MTGVKNILVLFVAIFSLALNACDDGSALSAKNPVNITLWHTYVEQMRAGLDALIAEFNGGVGAAEGITVTVTGIANARVINEKLLLAAEGIPGTGELPDMAVLYPRVAVTLAAHKLIVDLENRFTKDELSRYEGAFLDEGRFSGGLYLLPAAKSTEILFLNKTIFDKFVERITVAVGGGGST